MTLRAREIIAALHSTPDRERLIRCALELSDHDYDSLAAWIKKAETAPGELISLAEYDNRAVRKYDFRLPFDQQVRYSYANE